MLHSFTREKTLGFRQKAYITALQNCTRLQLMPKSASFADRRIPCVGPAGAFFLLIHNYFAGNGIICCRVFCSEAAALFGNRSRRSAKHYGAAAKRLFCFAQHTETGPVAGSAPNVAYDFAPHLPRLFPASNLALFWLLQPLALEQSPCSAATSNAKCRALVSGLHRTP